MNDKARFIFLLGGADLEMHTIRQLLDKNGYRYYDKHLRYRTSGRHESSVQLYQYRPSQPQCP